jgi:hypothetical protein
MCPQRDGSGEVHEASIQKLTLRVLYLRDTTSTRPLEDRAMLTKDFPIEGQPAEAAAELMLDSSAITMAFLNIPSEDYSEELESELLAIFRREPPRSEA